MKRSNEGSFITDLSSATGRDSLRNRASAITAATLNGREVSPITSSVFKKNRKEAVILEDSDEAIGYEHYVRRRF